MPSASDAEPRHPRGAPCQGCGKPYNPRNPRCHCDRAADAWIRTEGARRAAARGVALDFPDGFDDGRLFGGHMHDRDPKRKNAGQKLAELARATGVSVRRIDGRDESAETSPPSGHRLRHYRDWLAARIHALCLSEKQIAEEKRRLRFDQKLIDERFDGDGKRMEEQAEKRGRVRSWISNHFSRIESEAAGVRVVPRRGPACPCGCGEIVAAVPTGRPRRFATRRCAKRFARRVERRGGRKGGRKSQALRVARILRMIATNSVGAEGASTTPTNAGRSAG